MEMVDSVLEEEMEIAPEGDDGAGSMIVGLEGGGEDGGVSMVVGIETGGTDEGSSTTAGIEAGGVDMGTSIRVGMEAGGSSVGPPSCRLWGLELGVRAWLSECAPVSDILPPHCSPHRSSATISSYPTTGPRDLQRRPQKLLRLSCRLSEPLRRVERYNTKNASEDHADVSAQRMRKNPIAMPSTRLYLYSLLTIYGT